MVFAGYDIINNVLVRNITKIEENQGPQEL